MAAAEPGFNALPLASSAPSAYGDTIKCRPRPPPVNNLLTRLGSVRISTLPKAGQGFWLAPQGIFRRSSVG